ncbi:uncharacterized protein LACBIDRAFT_324910 [Laccaria bicolor S238N-H82]|uniref:Predicted protein n=1 Tax=Laccaria bicolor (strain S238N-H82 / ATCC MYA-4686) TaxID=486041 RepID=B0D3F7_LACBS|nr:uncharacterized protein LACBIDRAFT_324910 [Laccaria bicolor S238N-H82]EDR10911.1 predicted protein [Laccaria bicolor S238N-H82]|eukprot:XP_001878212.1 predicted protein [Laccaria bicolor S238N-H82]
MTDSDSQPGHVEKLGKHPPTCLGAPGKSEGISRFGQELTLVMENSIGNPQPSFSHHPIGRFAYTSNSPSQTSRGGCFIRQLIDRPPTISSLPQRKHGRPKGSAKTKPVTINQWRPQRQMRMLFVAVVIVTNDGGHGHVTPPQQQSTTDNHERSQHDNTTTQQPRQNKSTRRDTTITKQARSTSPIPFSMIISLNYS